MAGPSGFVQRFKGKVQMAELWLGNSQVSGPGAFQAYTTAAGTNGLSIGQIGTERLSGISATSGASVFALTQAIPPGVEKIITITTVSSAAFIKAPAGMSFNQSTQTVIKSTYESQIALVGMSSVSIRISGVWPPASTLVGGSGITLSTTT